MSNEKIMLRGMFWARVWLLIIVVLVATLTLSACTQQKSEEPDSSNFEYTQTVTELPDEFYPHGIYPAFSLEKTDNGALWMVGTTSTADPDSFALSYFLWELQDSSWKEIVNISELLGLDEYDYLCAASITKNNTVLCLVYDRQDYSSGMHFYLIDPELEKGYRELIVDTSEFIGEKSRASFAVLNPEIWSLKNEQFLVRAYMNVLFVFDATNGTIKRIPQEEDKNWWWRLLDTTEVENTVYVLYEDMRDDYSTRLGTLDVFTGSFNTVENEELTSLCDEYGTKEPFRIFPTMDAHESKISLCLRGGIVEVSDDEAKKVAGFNDTVLSDTSKEILVHVIDGEDIFYILCVDFVNFKNMSLYKYEKVAG